MKYLSLLILIFSTTACEDLRWSKSTDEDGLAKLQVSCYASDEKTCLNYFNSKCDGKVHVTSEEVTSGQIEIKGTCQEKSLNK